MELRSRAVTSCSLKFPDFPGFSGVTFYALSNELIKKGAQDFTQKSLLKIVKLARADWLLTQLGKERFLDFRDLRESLITDEENFLVLCLNNHCLFITEFAKQRHPLLME